MTTNSSITSVDSGTISSTLAVVSTSDCDDQEQQPNHDIASIIIGRKKLRSMNWKGCIPVEITLAQSSLSSPSMPSPLNRMVPRQSYLHVSLFDVIERLSMFAVTSPAVVKHQQQNAIINNTWLEDKQTKKPLRWHLFAGVLYDLVKIQHQLLPWKLTLHFSSYPNDKILSLSNGLDTVKQYYFNSLKQSLYMQYGNAKKSTTGITKHNHDILWESLKKNHFEMFASVNQHLQLENSSTTTTMLLPIRVLLDSRPVIQKPYRITVGETVIRRNNNKKLSETCTSGSSSTLGDLLLDWLPHLFHNVTPTAIVTAMQCTSVNKREVLNTALGIQPKMLLVVPPSSIDNYEELEKPCCMWAIQGVMPSLETPLLDLWHNLCHPDLFLYVIVRTTTNTLTKK